MSGGVTITEDEFGKDDQSQPVKRYTMKNKCGFKAQIINYGATITSLEVPSRNGPVDVVLGFDNMEGYQQADNPYFGATIGRVTNRTKPTKFKIGEKCVCLKSNMEGGGQIHGGLKGFDKVIWDSCINDDSVTMTYNSADGEEGYPGNLCVKVCFCVTPDNTLKIAFTATTDQTTIVNLTNHSYFNLAGHNAGADALKEHELQIESDKYTKLVDLICNGEFVPVDDTGYDFRKLQTIGDGMGKISEDGFDINYCLKPETPELKYAAKATYKPNGITMEVSTNVPGLQLYTSNNISKIRGKGNSCYKKYAAFCFETQHYPNAANIPTFPPIILNPGEEYKHEAVYKFSC